MIDLPMFERQPEKSICEAISARTSTEIEKVMATGVLPNAVTEYVDILAGISSLDTEVLRGQLGLPPRDDINGIAASIVRYTVRKD